MKDWPLQLGGAQGRTSLSGGVGARATCAGQERQENMDMWDGASWRWTVGRKWRFVIAGIGKARGMGAHLALQEENSR